METAEPDTSTRGWRPAASPGGMIGGLGIVVCLLLASAALTAVVGRSPSTLPRMALLGAGAALIVLALALIVLLWGYLTIGYELSDRELLIRWGTRRERIPLDTISHVGPATELLGEHRGGWQRFWPGYYVSERQSTAGPVQTVATLPPRRQLVISTVTRLYAISPEHPVLFVEEYGRLRRALGPGETGPGVPEQGQGALRLVSAGWTGPVPIVMPKRPRLDDGPADGGVDVETPAREPEHPAGTSPGTAARVPARLIEDSVAIGILAATVALTLGLIAYILTRYSALPATIPLHWNAAGVPDRVEPRRAIWTIPLIGVLVALANLGLAWSVARFDRFAARFLLAATCLVDLVAWVAVISLIR